MKTKHFLSYSNADALDFASKLYDSIVTKYKTLDLWWDKQEMGYHAEWDEQLYEGIKSSDSLIFVMTKDSVHSKSVCKKELFCL